MTRSPSQCPGTARSAASASRWVIRTLSGIASRPGGHRPPLIPAHPSRATGAQAPVQTHSGLSAGLAVQGSAVDRFGPHLPVRPVRVLAPLVAR